MAVIEYAMREKAVQPQFYKDLNYNQLRDIVPLRKREWDGLVIPSLDVKKPYQYKNYYDMIYTFDKGTKYPTSRKEGGAYQPPSFDVPVPSFITPIELGVETKQLLILNFNGDFVDEVNLIDADDEDTVSIAGDITKYGSGSLLLAQSASPAPWVSWTLNDSVSGDFTFHCWTRIDAYPTSSYTGSFIYLTGSSSTISAQLMLVSGSVYWRYVIQDKEGTYIQAGSSTFADTLPSLNEWFHLAFVVSSGLIGFYMNGNLLRSWTTSISDPFSDLINVIFYKSSTEITSLSRWVDAVEWVNYAKWLSNFMPPKHAPVKGVITV